MMSERLRTDKNGCVGCRRLREQLADVERIRAAEQVQAQELALCWAILHDRKPRHAGRTVLER